MIPKHKPIRLNKKDRAELRRLQWEKQLGRCAVCGMPVNLKGDSIFNTAHLSHIKSVGAGGGDTEENTCIKCFSCHCDIEHGPRWSK